METEKDILNLQKDTDSTLIPIFMLVGAMLKTYKLQVGKIIEVKARFQNDYHFPQFFFKEAVFELMSFLNEQSQGAGFGLDLKLNICT